MIGLTADAGDNFKKRASIPLAPCIFCERKKIWLSEPQIPDPNVSVNVGSGSVYKEYGSATPGLSDGKG
jgi:hypothetical protein